jgi:hypothetical protein
MIPMRLLFKKCWYKVVNDDLTQGTKHGNAAMPMIKITDVANTFAEIGKFANLGQLSR